MAYGHKAVKRKASSSSSIVKRRRMVGPARKTATNGTAGTGRGVSFQHDSAMVWKKPKYNKRKGRSFKKFAKKVRKVEAGDLGKRTIIINGLVTSANTNTSPATQTKQGLSEVNLYSCNGTLTRPSTHDKDFILNEVSNARQSIINTSGANPMSVGIDTNYTGDFERRRLSPRMRGARIDITWTNDSATNLECDLYIIKHTNNTRELLGRFKEYIGDPANAGDPAAYSNTLQYEDRTTGSGGSGEGIGLGTVSSPYFRPELENRGVTPFDLPDKAAYGMKIISKTKFFIASKNSITRQFTDPVQRKLKPHDGSDNYRYDKDTTTFLMIYKVTESDFVGSAFLACKYTKRYTWTQEGVKTNAIGYLAEYQNIQN